MLDKGQRSWQGQSLVAHNKKIIYKNQQHVAVTVYDMLSKMLLLMCVWWFFMFKAENSRITCGFPEIEVSPIIIHL